MMALTSCRSTLCIARPNHGNRCSLTLSLMSAATPLVALVLAGKLLLIKSAHTHFSWPAMLSNSLSSQHWTWSQNWCHLTVMSPSNLYFVLFLVFVSFRFRLLLVKPVDRHFSGHWNRLEKHVVEVLNGGLIIFSSALSPFLSLPLLPTVRWCLV